MRTVRYFYDLGHGWPLWEDGTDSYAMTPADYGLSTELSEQLAGLHAEFEAHWDAIDWALRRGQDWQATPWGKGWARRSEDALESLREELAGIAIIRDETGA